MGKWMSVTSFAGIDAAARGRFSGQGFFPLFLEIPANRRFEWSSTSLTMKTLVKVFEANELDRLEIEE